MTATSDTATPMLDAALDYAARGWPVFPLHRPVLFGAKEVTEPAPAKCSCRKPDCTSQGKHPRTPNGLTDATTDPDAIRKWWTKWPEANIGLITGVAFDVLDLDGHEALDALDDLAPGAPALTGPMVITGNGIHIYMEPTGAKNRTGMVPGIDWRGIGGYVVAPPSVHYRYGDRYEWRDDDPALGAVPTWLDDVVHKRHQRPPAARTAAANGTATRYGAAALERQLGRLALAAEGERNHTLNASAYTLGRLAGGGELDAGEVADALLQVALQIGLTESEAVASIRSGVTSGIANPRRPEVTR